MASLPGLGLQFVKLNDADDKEQTGRLIHAADAGGAPEVEQLLRLQLDPDCTRAEDDATPLELASRGGHLEVVRLLCEAGADRDKVNLAGRTALMWASHNGRLEVARMLFEAGADKDKANQYGDTALKLAHYNVHLDVALLLCEEGEEEVAARVVPRPR